MEGFEGKVQGRERPKGHEPDSNGWTVGLTMNNWFLAQGKLFTLGIRQISDSVDWILNEIWLKVE